MIRLEILDSSGFQPAENHVWHPDNDIPLRLLVRDGEGLETPLTIYTWSEYQDDVNGNGIMEESEYQSMTANINRGVLEAEVDLPLLDAMQFFALVRCARSTEHSRCRIRFSRKSIAIRRFFW